MQDPREHLAAQAGPAKGGAPIDGLLKRMALGDRESFAAFYEALSPVVYGLSLQILGDRGPAEEVTQEALVEMWRQAPRFDRNRASARAWSVTLAHDLAVRRRRAQRPETGGGSPRTPDGAVADMRDTLLGLTETQRKTVELVYFASHTYTEAAMALDIAPETVETCMRETFTQLRTRRPG